MSHANRAEWPAIGGGWTAFLYTCPVCAEFLTYDRNARQLLALADYLDQHPGERVMVSFPTISPSSSTSPADTSEWIYSPYDGRD